METVDLDMGELFDTEAVGDDEDVGAQGGRLPDFDDGDGPMRDGLGDEGVEDTQQDGDEGVVANLQRLSKGAAKKRVLRPQPKLDADRLRSERGLAILPRIFQDVKFKGKGHEAEDLKVLMGKLEHWAHRLFPKMPFDEFNDRMEKLQAKKPVQNTLNRIRLDLPILDDEYVTNYDGPEGNDEGNDGAANAERTETPADDLDAEEAFEEMIRQEQELQARRQEACPSGGGAKSSQWEDKNDDDDPFAELEQAEREMEADWMTSQTTSSAKQNKENMTPKKTLEKGATPRKDKRGESPKASQPPASQTPTSQPPASQPPAFQPPASQGPTPDVQARIEENKRRALEKRAARLGVPVSSLMSPKPVNKTPPKSSAEPTQSQSMTPTQESTSAEQTTLGGQPSDSISRNTQDSEALSERITCQGAINSSTQDGQIEADSTQDGQKEADSTQDGQKPADSTQDGQKPADSTQDGQTEADILAALGSDDDMEVDCGAAQTQATSTSNTNTDTPADDGQSGDKSEDCVGPESMELEDNTKDKSASVPDKSVVDTELMEDSEQVPLAGDI